MGTKDHYGHFNKIRMGDEVFIGAYGPCSGGSEYGVSEKVTKVTSKLIHTKDGLYHRQSGYAANEPWAYYIEFWRKQDINKQDVKN